MTYLPKISSSSATPLKRSVSYTKLPEHDRGGKELCQHTITFHLEYTRLKSMTVTYQRKMLLICFRMKALRPRNLP